MSGAGGLLLDLELHHGSRTPLYAQFMEGLDRAIADGRLGCGERLASETEWAALHRISVPTVHKAMERLIARRRIVQIRGVGTYVSTQPR